MLRSLLDGIDDIDLEFNAYPVLGIVTLKLTAARLVNCRRWPAQPQDEFRVVCFALE